MANEVPPATINFRHKILTAIANPKCQTSNNSAKKYATTSKQYTPHVGVEPTATQH